MSSLALYKTQHIQVSFPSSSVLLLSLARSPVNAFNDELWFELRDHLRIASHDNEVRCIVLNSNLDKLFTAGLDLTQSSLTTLQGADIARTALLLRTHIAELQDSVSAIELCNKPVIAAVHGLCIGAGLDIISACDVRIAASSAVFSIREVDVGLAADVGSLQRMPRKTGNDSLLRELAFTARNFNTVEAEKLGLISKVVEGGRVEVLAEALKLAAVIASKSPVAILGTKHLLNYSAENTTQAGLDYSIIWNMACLQSEDLTNAFAAFASKTKPNFRKLGKL